MSSSLPLVLVQGATGLTGVPLVKKLSASGKVRIRAATRNPTSSTSQQLSLLTNVELFQCNFLDSQSVNDSFQGVERAFLLNKYGLGDLNVMRENYLAAAKLHSCKFLFRYSGLGADVNSPQASSQDHGVQEEAVKNSGIPFTVVRPGGFAEATFMHTFPIPSDRTVKSIWGDNCLAPISLDDITSFCTEILINPEPHFGKTYTITGPQAVSLADMCTIISAATGKPLFYRKIEEALYREELKKKGIPTAEMIDFVVGLVAFVSSGKLDVVETADFERVLGRKAMSIEEWIFKNKNLWEGGAKESAQE